MTPQVRRRIVRHAVAGLLAVSGLLLFPATSPAQQREALPRIGVLLASISPQGKEVQEFRRGLKEAGYTEGRDILIDWRSADVSSGRLAQVVNDLIQSKVEVIVATSTPTALAAKQATSTVPIVMALVGDPLGSGLVPNLAHPGGNVTGVSPMTAELSAKRLQLLKDCVPRLQRVTVLWNSATPWNSTAVKELKASAPSLSIEVEFADVRTVQELGAAVSAANRGHAQALYFVENPLFFSNTSTLAQLASKVRLPAIYGERKFPEEGGLMSYGATYADLFHRAAGYVDRILRGAKPGDLPVEQATKFDFVINLTAAKAIGLTIPQSLRLQADHVIP